MLRVISTMIFARLLLAKVSSGQSDIWTMTHPDDVFWADGFAVPSVDSMVRALVVYGGMLVAGGDFSMAGDSSISYIAG